MFQHFTRIRRNTQLSVGCAHSPIYGPSRRSAAQLLGRTGTANTCVADNWNTQRG